MSNIKLIKGELAAQAGRFGIVVARFNASITERLLSGAMNELVQNGADARAIHVVEVPGAFEIPLALDAMAESGKYDALIALGAVIRGETAHFEYVSAECTRGIAEVSRRHSLPVVFGVLTVNTDEQAIERAGGKEGNKGAEAALTAIEMVNLLKKLRA
ncbi:MAG: 6,7-dimethyl-8-ribityllumazine synthase [Gammaproteobacteria bacterium]|nr:6,7-dimethyl-8-ribityllumazine synthase [Gammaproteobacteria bacterium]